MRVGALRRRGVLRGLGERFRNAATVGDVDERDARGVDHVEREFVRVGGRFETVATERGLGADARGASVGASARFAGADGRAGCEI